MKNSSTSRALHMACANWNIIVVVIGVVDMRDTEGLVTVTTIVRILCQRVRDIFSRIQKSIYSLLFFFSFFLLFRCSDSKCLASLISACRFAHISCKVRDSVFTCDFSLNDSIMHRFFDIFFYANRWPWMCARNESHVIRSNRSDDSFSERFHSNLQRHQFSHWTENGIRIVWFGCEICFFFCSVVILARAYFMLFPLYFCWRCSSKYLNERKNQQRPIIWRINKLSGFVKCICASTEKKMTAQRKCELLQ